MKNTTKKAFYYPQRAFDNMSSPSRFLLLLFIMFSVLLVGACGGFVGFFIEIVAIYILYAHRLAYHGLPEDFWK